MYLGGFGFILFTDQYLCPGIWVDLGSFSLQISTCVQVFGWTWVHSLYRSVLVSRYLGGLGFILFTDQYLCPGIWVDLGSFSLQISSCVQVFGWIWVHSVYRSVLVSRYLGGLGFIQCLLLQVSTCVQASWWVWVCTERSPPCVCGECVTRRSSPQSRVTARRPNYSR